MEYSQAAPAAGLSPETTAAIEQTVDRVVSAAIQPGVTLAGIGEILAQATKPFWQSKTLIAGVVAKVAAVAGMVGISLDPQNAVLIGTVSGVVTILGASFQSLFHVISTRKPV
jgi:hypothetical protein